MAVNHNKPHAVVKGDPKINGPYLDDIRADQERAYREARVKTTKKSASRKKKSNANEDDK